ncbi:response regulator [Streptomyces sp. NPDC000878]
MNQELSAPELPERPSTPESLSVLVVDDQSGTSDMLVMALRFLGFDAHLVATGAETVHEVRRRRPDAVLLDGTEVCGQLRAAGIDTPVIFLSARTAIEDKCHALAVGGDDYVTKPFDLTEVSARIRALIRRARGAVRAAPVASRRLCAAYHLRRKLGDSGQSLIRTVRGAGYIVHAD